MPPIDPIEENDSHPGEEAGGDESAASPEPDDAASPEPEKQPPAKDITIPKYRFDEVNERLREERLARMSLEDRLRALETPKPPPFDARAAEREYLDAVTEGDREKARELWEKIREHDARQTAERVNSQLMGEIARTKAQLALEAAAALAVDKYPFLDPTHPAANQKAIDEVVEWRDYLIHAKNMAPADALRQAVSRIAKTYSPESGAGPAGIDRTTAQRMTNAKAAMAQPPNTASSGIGERATRAQKLDVEKMSDAEFRALSESQRAALRGDLVR